MKKTEKEQLISAASEKFKKSTAAFLVEYRGLKVSQLTTLRRDLYKTSSELKVVKNRLAKLAVKGTKHEPLAGSLKGPLAIVFAASDPISAAKLLIKFSEESEKLKLISGVVGDKPLTLQEIGALAALPSKEEMYAKILGSMIAPITSFTRALKNMPQKLVRVLGAVKEQKEKEGGK